MNGPSVKLYGYEKCGTCRAAMKFLGERGVEATLLPVRERPPTIAELKRMLGYYSGDVRKLFNVSGQDYRALGLKDKLPGMSETDALTLLASNGNLVKRPFLLTPKKGIVGFDESRWRELLD